MNDTPPAFGTTFVGLPADHSAAMKMLIIDEIPERISYDDLCEVAGVAGLAVVPELDWEHLFDAA